MAGILHCIWICFAQRLTAAQQPFQPATPTIAASAPLAVMSFRIEGSLPNMPSAVTFTIVLTPE